MVQMCRGCFGIGFNNPSLSKSPGLSQETCLVVHPHRWKKFEGSSIKFRRMWRK